MTKGHLSLNFMESCQSQESWGCSTFSGNMYLNVSCTQSKYGVDYI